MSTHTLQRPDTTPADTTGSDSPEKFHHAKKDRIARSAVEGSHVVALCGETFPVTKAPKPGSPVCPGCERVYRNRKK